ncbi:MAG: hypothetical protein AAGE80_01795 [Pseudomonadota bacterium]
MPLRIPIEDIDVSRLVERPPLHTNHDDIGMLRHRRVIGTQEKPLSEHIMNPVLSDAARPTSGTARHLSGLTKQGNPHKRAAFPEV